MPFPEAVEANEKELAEVSHRESEIRSRPGGDFMAPPVIAAGGAALGDGKDLTEAIESLPEILARKANLEAHTNILGAVMKKIAGREVPTFFEAEQNILTSGRVDKAAVIALLKEPKGLLEDKARLLLLVAICGDSTSKTDEYEQAFTQGCNAMSSPPDAAAIEKVISSVGWVRRLQSLQTPFSQRLSGAGSSGGLTSLLSSATTKASSLFAKAQSFFTKFASLYVTKVVESLSEGRSCVEDDSFCALDPRGRQGDVVDIRGQKYSEVIVFVMGGGCYSEFFNLQDLLKHKGASAGGNLRNIIYGCTELMSGDGFLNQLQRLGSP